MSEPISENLPTATAQKLLETFSSLEVKPVESAAAADRLRQALVLLGMQADFVNLGICADSPELGLAALSSYATALGYSVAIAPTDVAAAIAPVYIKFNGQRQTYYLDSYTGTYRGVLVSFHSLVEDSVNGTYGYLPLDLFK